MVVGIWVQLLGGGGGPTLVFLVLCKCIWYAPMVLPFLSAFDNTSSLGSLHQVDYPPG